MVSEPVSPGANFSQLYQDEEEEEEDNEPVVKAAKTNYISFDFRCDLKDIKNKAFVLQMPQRFRKNIISVELESCILPMMPVLENESYIYLDLAEFEGDYITSRRKVFGKLIREKQNGNFLHFLPENCKKIFTNHLSLNTFTIGFYTYNGEPINLQHLDLQSITKNDHGQTYLHTKTTHYLAEGDSLTFSHNHGNKVTVDKLKVKQIVDKNTYIIETFKSYQNGLKLDAIVEKIDLKCTLTFKIQQKL
jgi:hypothetical protein